MSDSIIYEAQPIPPDGPEQGRRWSAIFGGVALIAVLLIGVAFGAALFRGDDEPDPLAEPDPTAPTVTLPQVTTTAPRSPLADRATRGGADSEAYSTRPGRGGGPDVGAPTPPLPPQDFTWEKISLDLPAGEEAYLQGVYAVDGGFLAIGMAWNEFGQDVVVWRSDDGATWERTELSGNFSDASVWNFTFNEYGGIAFGEAFTEGFGESEEPYREYEMPPRLVWTTSDGINWTRSEINFETDANQSVWLNSGVAGPNGFLVLGQRQSSPEFQPLVIEKNGYQLTISDYSYSYQLVDPAGVVVAEGSMDKIYGGGYHEDGQAVFNPDTGEVLVVVPYEDWEMAWEKAYNESNGGPFGGLYGYEAPIVTVEYDGYRITVDEQTLVYSVEDMETGEELFSGNAEDLWRGPAPVFTDEAGNEILSFTWAEYDEAQQAFWEGSDTEAYEYRAELIVATSTDGIDWTTSVVDSDAVETTLDTVIVRDNGYLAYGNHYDEFGGGPAIWSSTDGLSWTREADMPGGMYVWNVQQTPDGTLLAIGEGPQGTALWSSADGIAWGEAFGARVPEDRTLREWMNQFGTGDLGTVVIGSREANYYEEAYGPDPLTLTQGEYTLTFDDYDWPPRVTVVDNETEDIVIDVWLNEEGGLPEGFYYEDGVTFIENNDIVMLAITDDEWNAAQNERYTEYELEYAYETPQPTMYFSSDLDTWTEVPVEFEGWISTLAVGDNAVVLAGEEGTGELHPLEEGEDFEYTPPTPVLWVGHP